MWCWKLSGLARCRSSTQSAEGQRGQHGAILDRLTFVAVGTPEMLGLRTRGSQTRALAIVLMSKEIEDGETQMRPVSRTRGRLNSILGRSLQRVPRHTCYGPLSSSAQPHPLATFHAGRRRSFR